MTTATAPVEKLEFKTELKQLLHIITHSLYSHREIFLRELISNASDAINKIKFDALAHEELLEENKDWKIKIIPNRESNTLTISDNGIGMSREGIIDQLGTIAKSGTRAYLEHLRQQNTAGRPDLIGQFGVGFYSAFMVADRVTVLSRPAPYPTLPPSEGGRVGWGGVRWESEGQGEFTVEPVEKPTRGTDVVLHLKEDAKEFLDEWRLRELVRKFSNFIEHPVVMDVEKEEGDNKEITEETLNARAAIWLRPKKEVTTEEYREFYQQISGLMDEPARVIHYNAEGQQEYKVLLFIPSHRPFEMDWGGEPKVGPRLYIQRVLIMEHCETLLPPYLRFVKGVVDSSDLPLNISREILQQNPLLERIRNDLVRTVLKELGAFKEDENEKYVTWYKALGDVLKEGVARDWSNREKLADLLLFESMKTPAGQYTTLAKYVEAMPAEQKEIWFLIGDSREQIENSPYLEVFKSRGQDVLLLTDPIDEFVVSSFHEYKGKQLKGVDRGELEQDKSEEKDKSEQFKGLLEYAKKALPEVSDVRLSRRLKESAACLVASDGGVTAHKERLLQRMGRENLGEAAKRVLELNAEHPAVVALRELHARTPDDVRLEGYLRLLYDQAVIAEGSKVKDPAALARRINELLARDASST
jgi:molecular chaperone HtpG